MKVRVGILTAPHIEYEKRADTFIIKNVRIGIGFHWDRYEEQEFEGDLEIFAQRGRHRDGSKYHRFGGLSDLCHLVGNVCR